MPQAAAPQPEPAAPPLAAVPGGASIALTNRPQMPDALFHKFATRVYNLSGMRFETGKSCFLAAKISRRVQALGLNGFEAYWACLESPEGPAEYGRLLDEVTIHETFFFRHEPQLQAFREEVLMPLVFARRAQRQTRFRIWSAAASTGDELYTLALMLKEMGLTGKDIQFELVGTDISRRALEQALTATYRTYNLRNVPPALLRQYFTANGHGSAATWSLKSDVRQMCRFQEANLTDPAHTTPLGKFDIIFCRNVLTCFDEPSKEKAVLNLAGNLADDGFILLGHAENIHSQHHILQPDKPRALAYTKAPAGTPRYNV